MRILIFLIFILPSICLAENTADAYIKSQDEAITHFKSLAEATSKGTAIQTTISDNAMSYLTAVYLLCTAGNGTCPTVLQGILETDLINSISSGEKGCPLMKKFWITWKESDMDKRHQFMMKPVHTKAYLSFKNNVLPKYINCSATITSALEQNKGTAEFLRNRYTGVESPEKGVFSKLSSLLEKIKEKVPNVFVATQSAQTVDSEE